jgi:hypothetical protein
MTLAGCTSASQHIRPGSRRCSYPRWLTVAVHDGVVTIWGRAGRRSAASRLVRAALQAEGVIQVDEDIMPI